MTEAVNLSQTGSSTPQLLIAGVVVVIAAVALLVAYYRVQFVGLPEWERDQAERLAMQLEAQTPGRLRLPTDADIDDHQPDIRALWNESASPAQETGPTTVRGALAELHRDVVARWRESVGVVPLLSVRLVEEAVAIIVFGGVALVSAERWQQALQASAPRPTGSSVLQSLQEATTTVATSTGEVVSAVPFGETLWLVVFSAGTLTYSWLYERFLLVAAVLLIGAGLLIILSQFIEYPDQVDNGDHRQAAARLLLAVGGVWLAGVGPTVLGKLLGHPRAGLLIGVSGVILGCGAIMVTIVWKLDQLYTAVREFIDSEGTQSAALLYPTIQYVWGLFAAVAALLIPLYLGVAILDGQLFAISRGLRAASLDVQFAILLVIVGVVVTIHAAARDSWGELVATTRSRLSETHIRRLLLGRGAPLGVMGLVYLFGLGLQFSPIVSAVIAVAAGALMRGAYLVVARFKYRFDQKETAEREPSQLYIEAYTLEDANGGEHYLARINGTEFARADRDELLDDVVAQAETLQSHGKFDFGFARYHARRLRRFGTIDEDDSRQSLAAEIVATCHHLLDEHGGRVPTEVVEDELEQYPDDMVTQQLIDLRITGFDNWRVVRRGEYYILIQRENPAVHGGRESRTLCSRSSATHE